MDWLKSIFQGYAPSFMLSERDKHHLRRIVAMHGITEWQQEELNRLATNPATENAERGKLLMEIYLTRGALPKYNSEGYWIEYQEPYIVPTKAKTQDLDFRWQSLDDIREFRKSLRMEISKITLSLKIAGYE